jgi:acetamidase/formamidase
MNVISYRPDPSEFAWTFGGVPPVRTVRSGDVLELWTEDAFAGKIRGPDDIASKVIEFPFVNPQTGPFLVEGAEPGDTLAIHFVSIEPSRDWCVSTLVPLFGALTSTHQTVSLQDPLPEVVWIYELDRGRRTATYRARAGDYTVELPIDPMHGTVGVAPASFESRLSLVPDAYGGNMDTPEMRAGATCYLGVNVEGALFSLGDGHARQGEGETCGVALEAAMDTVIAIELIKGRMTPWPRIENDDYVITTGSARPLEDAFRIAHGEMIGWLNEEYGFEKLDAYQFLSQVSESPLANVCDPNYTCLAKVPKRYLPRVEAYDGTHAKLKEVADTYRGER